MNEKSSRSHAIFQLTLIKYEGTGARVRGKAINSERVAKLNLVDLAGSERLSTGDSSNSNNINNMNSNAGGGAGGGGGGGGLARTLNGGAGDPNSVIGDESPTATGADHIAEANSINQSLSTLRRVIEGLTARNAGGKNAKNIVIPYRESLLTYVLSDNFGGNSKTVMIANVSPAECNLGETESTLRYASLARGIRNRVKVNETAEARIIRELRERLRGVQEELLAAPAPELVEELELCNTLNAERIRDLATKEALLTRELQEREREKERLEQELKEKQEREQKWEREAKAERKKREKLKTLIEALVTKNPDLLDDQTLRALKESDKDDDDGNVEEGKKKKGRAADEDDDDDNSHALKEDTSGPVAKASRNVDGAGSSNNNKKGKKKNNKKKKRSSSISSLAGYNNGQRRSSTSISTDLTTAPGTGTKNTDNSVAAVRRNRSVPNNNNNNNKLPVPAPPSASGKPSRQHKSNKVGGSNSNSNSGGVVLPPLHALKGLKEKMTKPLSLLPDHDEGSGGGGGGEAGDEESRRINDDRYYISDRFREHHHLARPTNNAANNNNNNNNNNLLLQQIHSITPASAPVQGSTADLCTPLNNVKPSKKKAAKNTPSAVGDGGGELDSGTRNVFSASNSNKYNYNDVMVTPLRAENLEPSSNNSKEGKKGKKGGGAGDGRVLPPDDSPTLRSTSNSSHSGDEGTASAHFYQTEAFLLQSGATPEEEENSTSLNEQELAKLRELINSHTGSLESRKKEGESDSSDDEVVVHPVRRASVARESTATGDSARSSIMNITNDFINMLNKEGTAKPSTSNVNAFRALLQN